MIISVTGVGDIEFPDSMHPDEVRNVLRQKFPQTVATGSIPPEPRGLGLMKYGSGNPLQPLISPGPEAEKANIRGFGPFFGGAMNTVQDVLSSATTPALAAAPFVGDIPGVGPLAIRALGVGSGSYMGYQQGREFQREGVTPETVGHAAVKLPLAALSIFGGLQPLPPKPPVPQKLLGNGPIREVYDPNPQVMDLPGRPMPDRSYPQLGSGFGEAQVTIPGQPRQVTGPTLPKMLPPPSIPIIGQPKEVAGGGVPPPATGRAATFSELSRKANRTPEEEAQFQSLKKKSDDANKAMAAMMQSQVVAKLPTKYNPATLMPDGSIIVAPHGNAPIGGQRGWQGDDGKFYTLTQVARNEQLRTQERQNASSKSSTAGVPSVQLRPGVDEGTPLRQQGAVAPTQAPNPQEPGQNQVQTTQGKASQGQVQALPGVPQTGVRPQGRDVPQPGGGQSPVPAPEANGPGTAHEYSRTQALLAGELVPAIKTAGGILKATDPSQVTHADVLKANGIDPESIPHEDPRRGFVDSKGNFYTRKNAELLTGIKGTAKAGGLDSMDLPRAKTAPSKYTPVAKPSSGLVTMKDYSDDFLQMHAIGPKEQSHIALEAIDEDKTLAKLFGRVNELRVALGGTKAVKLEPKDLIFKSIVSGLGDDSDPRLALAGKKLVAYIKQQHPDLYDAAYGGDESLQDKKVAYAIGQLVEQNMDVHRAQIVLKDPQEWEEVREDVDPGLRDWIEYSVFSDDQRARIRENEAAQKSIGSGIKAALEKNKEAGVVNLSPVVDAWDKSLKTLGEEIKRHPVKQDMYVAADVADSKAIIVGDKAGTSLRVLATNTFGPVADRALKATTAALEAGGNVSALQNFINIATAANDKEALANARFAQAEWNRIQPLVRRAAALHSLVPGSVDPLYPQVQAGNGKSIRSWNQAEIVKDRLTKGLQNENQKMWLRSFASVNDPVTGNPIVSLTKRPGYTKFDLTGPSFYIHKGYESLFKAVVAASYLREHTVPNVALKVIGNTKHGLLAFDTYHLVKVELFNMSLTGSLRYKKGLSLLQYNPSDVQAAVQAGLITQDMANELNLVRPIGNLGVNAGLNIGNVSQKMDSDIADLVPFTGWARKKIFEQISRGAMMNAFIAEFKRQAPARYQALTNGGTQTPDDLVVAKRIARDLNFRFGNLGRQGLFKSRTAQDLSRLPFLAPAWFESMLNSEARSVAQLAKAPFTKQPLGTLGKSTGLLLFGLFVGTQIANYLSTGHLTFENPEEHKLDAFIPGVGKDNPGYYVSPLSIPMEITHDIYRYHEAGDSPLQIGAQIIGNKMSPYARATETMLTGRDFAGRPLDDVSRLEAAGLNMLPVPLAAQSAMKGKAQLQRQGFASIGTKVEPAERPNAQIARLARAYNEKHGVPEGSYPESEYRGLKTALEKDDVETAKKEYQKILDLKKKALVKDPAKVVEAYFHNLSEHEFTGSKDREDDFYAGLSKQRQEVYHEARKHNKELADKFFNQILGHPDKPHKTKRFSAFQTE